LLRFFAGCVRDDNPTGCLGFSVSALYDNAVVKGAEIHTESSKVVAPRTRRRKKAVRKLREGGLVTFREGHVTFDNHERLVDLAEFDPGYLDQSGPLLK
jgi:hypothetical protein